MNTPRAAGVNARKLFASWLGYMRSGGVVAPRADDKLVRLIDAPNRLPVTIVEQRLAAVLRESGALSSVNLVSRVAEALYEAELGRGAAVSDLGMFGSGLFTAEVVQELRAGDGILWKISH